VVDFTSELLKETGLLKCAQTANLVTDDAPAALTQRVRVDLKTKVEL